MPTTFSRVSAALPDMIEETLSHLHEGYGFIDGELRHVVKLLDRGNVDAARAIVLEVIETVERELRKH